VDTFSIPEGGTCDSIEFCQTGFECYLGKCVKPSYHLLGAGGGAVWGQDCNPVDGEFGCRCNYGSKIYQYLKESSITIGTGCPTARKDFEKCMIEKSCSSINTGAESCMRKYCYGLYNNQLDVCGPPDTLRYPRCGANEIFIMTILMVLLILL